MAERSLYDLFHRVRQVLPEEQEVVTIPPETPAEETLQLMKERNFSQLPVVQGREVLGVFSFRSFADKLSGIPKKERNPLALPVEEFLDELHFSRITDEIGVLFDEFDLKNAVLVGNESRLQGVVTTIDALRYFYRVANPYVLLREIELAIRELIRGSLTQEELGACAEASLGQHYKRMGREHPTSLKEMTLNDYVMLLRHKANWREFSDAFGGTRETTYAKLGHIPELRNVVFHFKRDVTAEEYNTLRDCRDWLLLRIRKVEATRRDA